MPPQSSAIATIIVVTHNSARWLERQLSALAGLSETRWRLVVIDNASVADQRPDPATLPRAAKLILSETNLGFAEANNRAAEEADTPYLVFLNPDAFPRSDWLTQLICLAERFPCAAAIGSTQLRADAEELYDGTGDVFHAAGVAYRSNYGLPVRKRPPLAETFSACAAAMLVRREAFQAVGGFDARYFCYFEDVDLCFRLRLQGWRILQSPDAIVAHVGGGVAGARSEFADFLGARNQLWTFVKCMPAPLFWPLLPIHVLTTTLAACLNVMRGRGFAAWRGIASGWGAIRSIWISRKAIQADRKATAADIAHMMAWSPHVFFSRQPVLRVIADHNFASPN